MPFHNSWNRWKGCCYETLALLSLTVLAGSGLIARPAQAQTFTFTSGTYFADHLANNGVGTAFDTLGLSSDSSTVTLTTGSPVIAEINGVTFTVGYSSFGQYGPISYSGSEDFTFDGITKTLTFPYSVASNDINTGKDVLQFAGGNSTIFNIGTLGQVEVTPQALTIAQNQSQNGTPTDSLTASFQFLPAPVPEASTTVSFGLLLALGLGSLAVARRRKRVTEQAA